MEYIPTVDERIERFKLEAFSFVGDHPFVYMHCKVKVCNATDPNSRCAQGCLHDRRKRSLYSEESNDEEYNLAQGPFMLQEQDINEANLQETVDGLRSPDITGKLWQNFQGSDQRRLSACMLLHPFTRVKTSKLKTNLCSVQNQPVGIEKWKGRIRVL